MTSRYLRRAGRHRPFDHRSLDASDPHPAPRRLRRPFRCPPLPVQLVEHGVPPDVEVLRPGASPPRPRARRRSISEATRLDVRQRPGRRARAGGLRRRGRLDGACGAPAVGQGAVLGLRRVARRGAGDRAVRTDAGAARGRDHVLRVRQQPHPRVPDPGRDGSVAPGERLVNLVWYRNYLAGDDLDDLLFDRTSTRREASMPPGTLRTEHLAEARAVAERRLPAPVAEVVHAVADLFLQVVVDLAVERMAFGRTCLIGDAAFAVRPHAAAGTAKAAADAWTLREALAAHPGDVPAALAAWEPGQLALGRSLLDRTRAIGRRSQVDNNWRPGDPELIFGLYGPGVSDDRSPRGRVARMVDACSRFVDSLDDGQRDVAVWPFPSDEERRQWFYTPTDHGGLPLAPYGRAAAAAGVPAGGHWAVDRGLRHHLNDHRARERARPDRGLHCDVRVARVDAIRCCTTCASSARRSVRHVGVAARRPSRVDELHDRRRRAQRARRRCSSAPIRRARRCSGRTRSARSQASRTSPASSSHSLDPRQRRAWRSCHPGRRPIWSGANRPSLSDGDTTPALPRHLARAAVRARRRTRDSRAERG